MAPNFPRDGVEDPPSSTSIRKRDSDLSIFDEELTVTASSCVIGDARTSATELRPSSRARFPRSSMSFAEDTSMDDAPEVLTGIGVSS